MNYYLLLLEDNISKSQIYISKFFTKIIKNQILKKLFAHSKKINFHRGRNLIVRESAILIVVFFYFLWIFADNTGTNIFAKDISSSESDQYLSATYTYVDATVLTGQVQKETYTQYTIQPKETLSVVAKKNELHVDSILQANNIKPQDADLIKPGTVILIPTEDLGNSNEWIIASNVRIEKEKAEEEAKIAAEKKKKLALSNSRNVIARSTSGKSVGSYNGTNLYPWGYCTWYVASRRSVPRWGNAGQWLSGARASGYATGSSPRPGAIFVSTESPVGHVGIVESVNGNTMTVSEMNYGGFGRYNTRTMSVNDSHLKGFIY